MPLVRVAGQPHALSGEPAFENWNQDPTAIANAYGAQDPAVVSVGRLVAAEAAAGSFDAVGDGDWERTGRHTNGSVFTLETLGRYFLHDLAHHLHHVRGRARAETVQVAWRGGGSAPVGNGFEPPEPAKIGSGRDRHQAPA
jgi:hypothetical protein